MTILSIFAFFFTYAESKDIAYSIGSTLGYVYIWSVPCAVLGILFMNKFKFIKKEFWTSWFFSLTWIFLILITSTLVQSSDFYMIVQLNFFDFDSVHFSIALFYRF